MPLSCNVCTVALQREMHVAFPPEARCSLFFPLPGGYLALFLTYVSLITPLLSLSRHINCCYHQARFLILKIIYSSFSFSTFSFSIPSLATIIHASEFPRIFHQICFPYSACIASINFNRIITHTKPLIIMLCRFHTTSLSYCQLTAIYRRMTLYNLFSINFKLVCITCRRFPYMPENFKLFLEQFFFNMVKSYSANSS